MHQNLGKITKWFITESDLGTVLQEYQILFEYAHQMENSFSLQFQIGFSINNKIVWKKNNKHLKTNGTIWKRINYPTESCCYRMWNISNSKIASSPNDKLRHYCTGKLSLCVITLE